MVPMDRKTCPTHFVWLRYLRYTLNRRANPNFGRNFAYFQQGKSIDLFPSVAVRGGGRPLDTWCPWTGRHAPRTLFGCATSATRSTGVQTLISDEILRISSRGKVSTYFPPWRSAAVDARLIHGAHGPEDMPHALCLAALPPLHAQQACKP